MRSALHGRAIARVFLYVALLSVRGLGQTNRVSLQPLPIPSAQTPDAKPTLQGAEVNNTIRPLPDIPATLHRVEANQKLAEILQKNYLYRAAETAQELDNKGYVKKSTTKEYEDFWISGVPVRRLVKKDGKELSTEEQKKESDRIDKEAAKEREKRQKGDAAGKETDPRGNEEITVSRFLELGHFTNARRVQLNRRDTISVDYVGDPKAKTRNRSEEVIRDLAGTVWIDEQDLMISRVEGHFLSAFKIGAGLVMNVRKDTSFALELAKINDEVWLPARVNGQGAARALLFFNFDGRVQVVYSDYRKFRTASTIVPAVTTMQETGTPAVPDTK